MRAALLLIISAGCFTRPTPLDHSTDASSMPDAPSCPVLGDDFENPAGPPCGTWGANYSAQPMVRAAGAVQASVSDGLSEGCIGSALDLRESVWLQIDLSQSGSDLTVFSLDFGSSFLEIDFDDNGTPTYQGKASPGILVEPSVSQPHTRTTQKFWRFTRGVGGGQYPYAIDLATSTDGLGYLTVLHFSISGGTEPITVTPKFRVTGETGSPVHASTIFDNYNRPCL